MVIMVASVILKSFPVEIGRIVSPQTGDHGGREGPLG
jgi:hypothetical protein